MHTPPSPSPNDATPPITKRRPVASIPPLGRGRYRLLERIGVGGMGEVFAARDEVMGREIAIKRLLDPAPTAEHVERFFREARIQGALDHPAIPPVHELAQDDDGRPYLVMKRLAGTTLAEILARLANGDSVATRRYPRERLLRAFAEACLALELAHVRGVIHRDLKPTNIMLGDFGEVFVLDWGVACVVSSFDHDLAALRDPSALGEIAGTTPYMAPEQYAGAVLSGRTDVFALGCMLYEILTGRQRYRAETVPGEVPPELAELCDAATAPEVAARPSARELGEAVLRYLDGDRDAALRRELAREHLARARAAGGHKDSMREAGRALALDPTLPGAAELVGRLMLEPPSAMPPEVEASLGAAHAQAASAHARIAQLGYLAYALLVPFVVWLGMTSSGYIVALLATIAALGVLAWHAVRHPISRSPFALRLVLPIVLNAVAIALLARMFSPFLLAPGVAALTVAIMLGSPAYRRTGTVVLMVAAMTLAILGPWFAELVGWVSPTIAFEPGLKLVSSAFAPDEFASELGLTLYVLLLIILTAVIMLRHARLEETAQRQLHFQAWRLEQLVPLDT